MENKLYTAQEVAEILKVNNQTVLRWIRENKLKSNRVGGLYRISQSQLNDFIQNKGE